LKARSALDCKHPNIPHHLSNGRLIRATGTQSSLWLSTFTQMMLDSLAPLEAGSTLAERSGSIPRELFGALDHIPASYEVVFCGNKREGPHGHGSTMDLYINV
jgi:hypothetical protein